MRAFRKVRTDGYPYLVLADRLLTEYRGQNLMKDMPTKVHDSMYRQCQKRGYAAPVDVLMDIGVLDKTRYDDWRAGRIPYLEAACTANLHKLSEMMKEMRSFAAHNGWKPSVSSCKHKGKPLRFSRTGNPGAEEAYATHYVMEDRGCPHGP